MTLQTSGPMSFGDINVELGVARTTARPLGSAAARALAGVASGAIRTAADFRGKSNVVFTPDGGTTSGTRVLLSDQSTLFASVTISCSASAVWTWSGGTSASYVTVSSGGSATSITFEVDASPLGGWEYANFTVQATSGSTTRYWSVELIAEDNS